MLRYGDARGASAGIGNWPFRDHRPSGCIELLDFSVGYDKEAVVGPEETSVEPQCYRYLDVHEQAAIITVIDANRIASGRRDAIALRRVFRCEHGVLVVQCLYRDNRWWNNTE